MVADDVDDCERDDHRDHHRHEMGHRDAGPQGAGDGAKYSSTR